MIKALENEETKNEIKDGHNSRPEERAAGPDDLIVHFAGNEKVPSRLSVIVHGNLPRGGEGGCPVVMSVQIAKAGFFRIHQKQSAPVTDAT